MLPADMLFTVLLGLLISQGVLATSTSTYYTCDFIKSFASCDRFITPSYCGTNGVTYSNKCVFSKAHCSDISIDLRHIGDCTDLDVSTHAPIAGNEVIVDLFCTSLSHIGCSMDVSKVCANDTRTYINYCEFQKAKCTHKNIAAVTFGTDCV